MSIFAMFGVVPTILVKTPVKTFLGKTPVKQNKKYNIIKKYIHDKIVHNIVRKIKIGDIFNEKLKTTKLSPHIKF